MWGNVALHCADLHWLLPNVHCTLCQMEIWLASVGVAEGRTGFTTLRATEDRANRSWAGDSTLSTLGLVLHRAVCVR